MTTKQEMTLADTRAPLEHRANVLRSRLLRTIDALDHRRKQVEKLTRDAKKLAAPVGLAAIGVIVATIAVGIGVRAMSRRRREQDIAHRIGRFLREVRRERRPSLLEDVARKVVVTIAGFAAAEAAKRGATYVLKEKH